MKKNAFRMLSVLVFGALTVLLTGCGDKVVQNVYSYEEFELIGIDPPKRMKVDLKNVQTGEIFRDVRVAKWCGKYKSKAVIGNVYRLKQTELTYESGRFRIVFPGLTDTFC